MSEGIGPYRAMSQERFIADNLVLRAVEPGDIEAIRIWRNSQMDILRQATEIAPEEQALYFSTQVWPEKPKLQPAQVLFAIERGGNLIGYGGLVHISWVYKRAEVSFLLDPGLDGQPDERSSIFSLFLKLLKRFAFEKLGLERLTTETYVLRPWVTSVLEQNGFIFEGRLRKHVVVQGRRTDAVLHGCNLPAKGVPERNVLVTSASRKAPLLRAMRDALQRIDSDARLYAGDLDAQALARYVADDFWAMPRVATSELETLIAGCRARGIGAVLPTRDGELAFWAHHRAAFAAAGISVIVSPTEAVERCLDKLAFSRFGAAEGLPVIPAAEAPETLGEGPYVVKERYGAGALGIGLDLDIESAKAHAKTLEAPLFQPYIQGPEVSVDGWLNADGRAVGVVLRRRDRVIHGESQVTTTFRDVALEVEACRILQRLDLRGPIVMQAILTAQGMRVIEVNPRFGGASTLGIAAGLDPFFWSLNEAFGTGVEPNFVPLRHSLRQVRLPADIVFHDPDI